MKMMVELYLIYNHPNGKRFRNWLFQRKNILDLENFFRLDSKLFRSAFAETQANFCGNDNAGAGRCRQNGLQTIEHKPGGISNQNR